MIEMKKTLFALIALTLIFTGCGEKSEDLYQIEPPPSVAVTASGMPADTKWLGATCEITELAENGEDISTIKANRVFRSRSELDEFIAGIEKNEETRKVLGEFERFDNNFFVVNALYYSTKCEGAGMQHEFNGAAFVWDTEGNPSVEVYMKTDSSMCRDSSSEFCYFIKLAQSEIQDIPDERFRAVVYNGEKPVSPEETYEHSKAATPISVSISVYNSHDYFENDIGDKNKVFRSREDLDSFIERVIRPNYANGVPEQFAAYDEEFFNRSILFYTAKEKSSGSVRYFTEDSFAEKYRSENGEIVIDITLPSSYPDICTEDMAYFCIFAALDRNDTVDVDNNCFSLNNSPRGASEQEESVDTDNAETSDDEDLDDFIEGLAYVDEEIAKITLSDEYKSGDAESRAALLIPVMKRLKSEGHIHYYIYSKDSHLPTISFEYSVGALGGVQLVEFPADKN